MELACSKSLSASAFAPQGTPTHYLEDTNFDTEHLRLDLRVDLRRRAADGTCTMSLRVLRPGVRSLRFDAAEMKILRVTLDGGKALPFTHRRSSLEIRLPKGIGLDASVTVAIRYRIRNPRAGLFFVQPDRQHPDKPYQVWTHGEPDDARYWFPCRDVPAERMTTEMMVTVDEPFVAISNGVLIDERRDPRRRTRTFHWRMSYPHSPYLVSLCAGEFAEIKDEWDGIPIVYYCPPGREEEARRGFGKTPRMMEFFSREIGVRYPYERYAQVAVADYSGGMEHTTAATQTDVALLDKQAALDTDMDGLVSHELSHQWFGDLVTCRDWSQAWLNESFATFYELLFQEYDKGREHYLYLLNQDAKAYFDEASQSYARPIVTRTYRQPFQLFDRHLYEKGACVLHFFRSLVGPDGWRASMRRYLESHRAGIVETRDLIEAIRLATGHNLEAQFDQWVYRAGHPDLRVEYSWDPLRHEARLWVLQRQAISNAEAAFEFPVDVRLDHRTYHETLKGRECEFRYRLAKEPRLILLDPETKIAVKKVDFTKPPEAWRHQLERDPNPLGRIEAARVIAGWRTRAAVDLLAAAYHRERHWGPKGEMARALGKVASDAAQDALEKLVSEREPRARRAVVDGLGEIGDDDSVELLTRLLRSDPSIRVRASAARALGRTGSPKARPALLAAMRQSSWVDLVRQGAIEGLAALDGPECVRSLAPYVSYGQPYPVRAAALSMIARHGRGEARARKILLAAVHDRDRRVSITAVRVLAKFRDPAAIPTLRKIQAEPTDALLKAYADSAVLEIRQGLPVQE